MSERSEHAGAADPPTPTGLTHRPIVGWREWVVLPDFDHVALRAKVDTGARTSALHVEDLVLLDDGRRVAFTVPASETTGSHDVRRDLPVTEHRLVRSSNGVQEDRPVVLVRLTVGTHLFDAELSLTSRDEMGYPMLLGRSAMRRRFLVAPGRSFLMGEPHGD
jgi:hypothetical protein